MQFDTRVTVWTCNACGAQIVQDKTDIEPPMGMHGKMFLIDAGGTPFEFWSCTNSPGHIQHAMQDALELELADPDQRQKRLAELIGSGLRPREKGKA